MRGLRGLLVFTLSFACGTAGYQAALDGDWRLAVVAIAAPLLIALEASS